MTAQNQRVVMWVAWSLCIACALSAVGLIIGMAISFSWPLLTGVILLAVCAVVAGCTADYYMEEPDKDSIFGSTAEDEILSKNQKKVLREARAEVLLELAMTDVEQEKANIEHRKMQDSNDMSAPPYDTSFTNRDGSPKQIGSPPPRSRNY